jgi:hypothetical protein
MGDAAAYIGLRVRREVATNGVNDRKTMPATHASGGGQDG